MKIAKVSAIPMSAPVPKEKRHRTDLGTKVKSDATLIRVETDSGLIGVSSYQFADWKFFVGDTAASANYSPLVYTNLEGSGV